MPAKLESTLGNIRSHQLLPSANQQKAVARAGDRPEAPPSTLIVRRRPEYDQGGRSAWLNSMQLLRPINMDLTSAFRPLQSQEVSVLQGIKYANAGLGSLAIKSY